MPRNNSGTYTLPAGNPVVVGTLIEASWANDTLNDLASAMTDSLSRNGEGGMLASFRLADGTLGAPGLAFTNETSTGFYRASAGTMWGVVSGSQILQYTTNGVLIPSGKTLTAQGNATVGGTLGVTGAATLSSTLAVTGAITATGGVVGNISGGSVSGTTGAFSSTLSVTGATTLTGALAANGGISTTNITASGDLTLSGTAKRIFGDFSSNSPISDRLIVQTTTANSNTLWTVMPSGSSTTSRFIALNNSTPTNSNAIQVSALATDVRVQSLANGSASAIPLYLMMGGTTVAALSTGNNFLVGTTTDDGANKLQVTGNTALTGTLSVSGNTTLSGGTANGVLYLNGSKVATSGSALTFDGTTFKVAKAGGVFGPSNLVYVDVTSSYGGVTLNSASGQNCFFELYQGGTTKVGEFGLDAANSLVNIGGFGSYNTRFYAAGSEQMRLTSTGLGIGTSSWSTSKLYVLGNTTNYAITSEAPNGYAALNLKQTSGNTMSLGMASNGLFIYDNNAGTTRLTIDSSGNLGLGVTPSAWGGVYGSGGVLDFKGNVGIAGFNQSINISANSFWNGSNWIYKSSTGAGQYQIAGNAHQWYTAASGTAGNAITFTQAMTLDASGNLSVGTTTAQTAGSNYTALTANGSSGSNLALNGGGTNIGLIYAATGNSNLYVTNQTASGNLIFGSGSGTERARITSGGYFKASNDGTYVESTQCHELRTTEDARTVIVTATNASYTSDAVQIRIARNTTNNTFYALSYYNTGATAYKFRVADSGNVTNTNGSYGTISDVKMKTDIVDAGSQWADIKAVRFRKFKMKDDPQQIVQLGVVAQELEQTSPGLVEEHADYEQVEITDEEGNVKKERQPTGTTTKSVKTSVLLMKAAVALQEAMARIEQLEAKVAALESKGV